MEINILLSDDTVVSLQKTDWKDVDLIAKDRRIVEMAVIVNGNKHFLEKNQRGYVFINKFIGSMNNEKISLVGIGSVPQNTDDYTVSWILEDNGTMLNTKETRNIKKTDFGVYLNKNVKKNI